MDDTIQIPLTQGKVTVIDAADYDLVRMYKWHYFLSKGKEYAAHTLSKRQKGWAAGAPRRLRLHRLLLNAPAGMLVDHIDGDGLNNRRSNLRLATSSDNAHNRRDTKHGSSQYIGVYWLSDRRRWHARVKLNNRFVHVGYFQDELAAARARDTVARKLHGEFAVLNDLPLK